MDPADGCSPSKVFTQSLNEKEPKSWHTCSPLLGDKFLKGTNIYILYIYLVQTFTWKKLGQRLTIHLHPWPLEVFPPSTTHQPLDHDLISRTSKWPPPVGVKHQLQSTVTNGDYWIQRWRSCFVRCLLTIIVLLCWRIFWSFMLSEKHLKRFRFRFPMD